MSGTADLPFEDARRVNAICRRFEDAWRTESPRPTIEAFADEIEPKLRSVLLSELIAIELELRFANAEPVTIGDYRHRFPELDGWLDAHFRDLALSASPTVGHPKGIRRSEFKPNDRIGSFTLGLEIGRGGMGVVYEAHDKDGKRVALKLLLESANTASDKQVQRFGREIRIIESLKHPNIIPVIESGEVGNRPYLAMPFIEGPNLARVLAAARSPKEAPLPEASPLQSILTNSRHIDYVESVVRVGIDVADALHHAHRQGVLHRDVKPSNLIIDHNGVILLTDFGLARSVNETSTITGTGEVLGTLRFMPPEAFQGSWDARSDIYSLGATLYEMLTLRPAFPGTDPFQLMHEIMKGNVIPPREHNPAVSGSLEAVVLRAMDQRKTDRQESAGQFADELRRSLETPSTVTVRQERNASHPSRRWVIGAGAMSLAGVATWRLWPRESESLPEPLPNPPPKVVPRTSFVWPGLLPKPMPIEGVSRWQMNTLDVLGRTHGSAWSPDGKRLALATDQGLVRIYDLDGDSYRLTGIIPADPNVLNGVSWSKSGRIATAG